jgi:hypothetical protein
MLRAVALLVTLAVSPAAVEANAGPRWNPGDPAGEPAGIEHVRIDHEALTIDLRPLATADGLAGVSALYHLENRGGEEVQLDLVFATGSRTTDVSISLDSIAVASAPSHVELPASWTSPPTTPGPGGEAFAYRGFEHATPIGFHVLIPRGKHDLAVRYRGEAAVYYRGDPTIVRQFAYVLAPARAWAGFGGLDVLVHVPPGWRAEVTPSLERNGDTLRGTFTSVPADALAISVQAPPGAYALLRVLALILLALVVCGGGFVVAWHTRVIERKHQRVSASMIAALVRGVVWGAAVLGAGVLAVVGPAHVLPAGHADRHGFGDAVAILGVVLLALLVVAIGTIVSRVAGNRVHRVDAAPE